MSISSQKNKINSTCNLIEDGLLKSLVNNCNFGIMVSIAGRLKIVNSACFRLLGLTAAPAETTTDFTSFADILNAAETMGDVSADDLTELLALERDLREQSKEFSREVRINGRPLEITGAVVAQDTHSISFYDLSEKEDQNKRMHAALEEAELAKAALNQISKAILIKNEKHEYVYANEAGCKLHGVSADQLLGRTPYEVFDEKLAKWIVETDDALFQMNIGDAQTEVVEWNFNGSKFLSATKTLFETHLGDRHIITLLRDVTQQKQKEAQLSKALEKAELSEHILEQLKTPVIVRDENLRVVAMNRAYADFYHLDLSTVTGALPDEFLPGDLAEKTTTQLKAVLETGHTREDEQLFIDDTGKEFHTLAFKTLAEAAGNKQFVVTSIYDVTRYKRQEARLKEALEKAELSEQVLEQLKTPVIVRDPDHAVMMMNQAYADFFGVDRDTAIGSRPEDFLPKEHADKTKAIEKDVLETGKMREVENIYVRPSGESVNMVIHKGLALGSENRQFLVSTINDVTRFKRQETRLQDALAQAHLSELVLDQLGVPIHVKDISSHYVMVNKAYSEAFGAAKEEIVGKPIEGILLPDRARKIRESDKFVINSGIPQEYEGTFYDRNGSPYPVIVKKNLVSTDQNQEFLVTVFQDISRLKEKEHQLRAALTNAELSAQVLDQLPYPVAVKDSEFRYVMANETFGELLNTTADELIGKSIGQILPEGAAETIHEANLSVLRTGDTTERDNVLELQPGKPIYLRSRDSYLHCNGEDYIVSALLDVTQMRRQEDRIIEILRQAELTEAVLDQLPTPVIVKDLDLRYVFANKAFCTLRGISREQLIGKKVDEMFSEGEFSVLGEYDRAILETGAMQEVEHDVPLPGGSHMISRTRKSIAKTKAGESYIVTALNKIDELKELERQFKAALTDKERLERMLDADPMPIAPRGSYNGN